MHDSCEGINAGNYSGIVTGRVSIPSKNDIWENKRHMQVGPTDYMKEDRLADFFFFFNSGWGMGPTFHFHGPLIWWWYVNKFSKNPFTIFF